MHEKLVRIPSMSCSYCSRLIRRRLGAIRGVQNVEVHLSTKEALVRWDAPATWEEIARMLEEIDYPPEKQKHLERSR